MNDKRQSDGLEIALYNLSLFDHLTEIADDILFEEYRDITHAKLDKELLEMGITSRRLDCLKFDLKYIIDRGSTSS